MLDRFLKPLIVVMVFSRLSFGDTLKDVEVYSNYVYQNENNVTINGNIVVNYDGKILRADSGFYNKATKILTLKDNVTLIDKSGKRVNAKELKYAFDSERVDFKSFFEIDKNQIWISALKATKLANNIKLENALFSSCDVINPDWKVAFKKAKYDTKSDELKLYGATIYAKSLPIFYLPYLYVPLSKKRRSGLLFPTFDYINKEGFLYSQPYYFAINKSQDLEIEPQVRTNRGFGLFATYRFVDSKDSFGKIKLGYFKDKQSYKDKYKLKYKEHYGAELLYINNSLIDYLAKNGIENKLYINGVYFSDSEYINLQVSNRMKHHKIGAFYESRLNYYLKSENFYSSISLNYYKDTSKDNNKKTIKILPKFTFALPYRNILSNNLSYSLEFNAINYTRQSGSKALDLSLSIPIDLHFNLFDGYLGLNISNELVANGYDFYNVPLEQKKYSSIVLNNTVELTNEMVAYYSIGRHISMVSLTYTKSHIISQNYMKYKDIPKDLKVNFVDDIPYDSKLTLRTHQYFTSSDNSLDIDYLLEANYYPDDKKLRNLIQELNLKYKNYTLNSKLTYSFLHKQATDIYNSIGYSNQKYGLFLSYLWQKDILSFETTTKEISLSAYYNYSNNLKFNSKISYDLQNSLIKNWEIGTYLNRKCWSLNLSVGEDVRPIIKSGGGSGSISNKYVKVKFKLLPFGN